MQLKEKVKRQRERIKKRMQKQNNKKIQLENFLKQLNLRDIVEKESIFENIPDSKQHV